MTARSRAQTDTNFVKPPKTELQNKLTPMQFEVTQNEATEPPYKNEFWDFKGKGIYVDVVSGEALFSSADKYDSHCGWPSFTKPIPGSSIEYKTDYKMLMPRTEVRSGGADSHLGHVFDDGPGPDGKRFCINSASLRFIPYEKMQEQGYGKYLGLFGDAPAVASSVNQTALLAGGCFWGMEELIRKLPGVVETEVGYTGGKLEEPHYEQVKTGATGHAESIRVTFNPKVLSYHDLLVFFFKIHDPTTVNRQGNDRGTQYRSAVFYTSDEQRTVAEQVKAELNASGKWKAPIVTEIAEAGKFYDAEDYHQDYLEKHPGGYTCHYIRE